MDVNLIEKMNQNEKQKQNEYKLEEYPLETPET